MEYVGRGSICRLGELLPTEGETLFITRKSIYRRFASILAPQLTGRCLCLYDAVTPNPAEEDIRHAQSACGGRPYRAIIAFGGGSVIDFAKAWRHSEGSRAPLIAIPTTAGTGSEATQFAVVYRHGQKTSLDSPLLLPEHAIVDSSFVEAAPRYLKACCAMDAYCQAIESYWARRADEASRHDALEAIALCRDCIVQAVTTADPAANAQLARAAHLAGKAINTSRTTAAHALSYRLTSAHGIPHGHAVALSIAGLYRANRDVIPQRHRLLEAMGTTDADAPAHFARLMRALGLETALPTLGIDNPDDIVDSVNPERLSNNPRPLSREELRDVLCKGY